MKPEVPADEVDPERVLGYAKQLRELNQREDFNPIEEGLLDPVDE